MSDTKNWTCKRCDYQNNKAGDNYCKKCWFSQNTGGTPRKK